MPREDLIQYRRDTAANWATANPVLEDGEVGYDKTNKQLRVGDGTSAWADLPVVSDDSALAQQALNTAEATADIVNDGRLSEPELSATTVAALSSVVIDASAAPYNVVGDGVTDWSTALTAAATYADGFARSRTVRLPSGTILAENLPISTGLHWEGAGQTSTVVKLPNGSTGDVFIGDDFDTLTGTTYQAGAHNWSIKNLSIDGNKSGAPSSRHGIVFFGYEFLIEDVSIYRCKRNGLRAEYYDSSGATWTTGLMESYTSRVKVFDCGEDGFYIDGCHDSIWSYCISARNGGAYPTGAGGTGYYANFYVSGDGNHFFSCHGWGDTKLCWRILGEAYLHDCQGEGANGVDFMIEGDGVKIYGGKAFFPESGSKGVVVGTSGYSPTHVEIRGLNIARYSTKIFDFAPAIDLTYAGEGCHFDISIEQATGTPVAGSPPADAFANIAVSGGAGVSVFQWPGFNPAPSTRVVTPALMYDAFTGADASALDTAKWDVATGGAVDAAAYVQFNRARLVAGKTGSFSSTDTVTVRADTALVPTTLFDAALRFKLRHRTRTAQKFLYAGLRTSQANFLTGTGYGLTIIHSTGNIWVWEVVKYVSGSLTTLYSGSGRYTATPADGTDQWFDFQVKGTALSVKTWLDGVAEPTLNNWEGTDASIGAGGAGFVLTSGSAAGVDAYQDIDQAMVFAL